MNCTDCGAAPGEHHRPDCDIERCPYCGGQLIVCGHDPPLDDRILWDGFWPGEKECAEHGWVVRFDENQGKYIPCEPGDPDARPDINRFRLEYCWNRRKELWVKK
jgi:hypothetical protein